MGGLLRALFVTLWGQGWAARGRQGDACQKRGCETGFPKAPPHVFASLYPSGVSTTRRGHRGLPRARSELAAPEVTCKQNPTAYCGNRRDTWCELQPQDHLPVCEVGVSGVGAATSCVPLSRPEAVEGSPRVAGFRECLNRSSRSRRSRSASSAARLAPWEAGGERPGLVSAPRPSPPPQPERTRGARQHFHEQSLNRLHDGAKVGPNPPGPPQAARPLRGQLPQQALSSAARACLGRAPQQEQAGTTPHVMGLHHPTLRADGGQQ